MLLCGLFCHNSVIMVTLLSWTLLFHHSPRQKNQVLGKLRNAVKMLFGVYLSFMLVMRSRLAQTNLIW